MAGKNGNAPKAEVLEEKKLTPQQAVNAAFNYLISVLPGGGSSSIRNVRIEELERVEEEQFWQVVLSYDAVGDFAFEAKREYKEFRVDAKTGNVLWMKIKKID
jgi:hypothetical protein